MKKFELKSAIWAMLVKTIYTNMVTERKLVVS